MLALWLVNTADTVFGTLPDQDSTSSQYTNDIVSVLLVFIGSSSPVATDAESAGFLQSQ